MTTAGVVLKEARRRRKKSLAQIARQTKIKEFFLSALEDSRWSDLPNFAVTQGFAKTYAKMLGVDVQRVAALLRRDFPKAKEVVRPYEMSLVRKVLWTPRRSLYAFVGIVVLILGLYLGRQYFLFVSPPQLEIESVGVGEDKVLVAGKTSPNATVEVNGRPVLVREDGSFEAEVAGVYVVGNVLEIRAVSRSGRETVVEKVVDGASE